MAKQANNKIEIGSRELLLAGIGAVSLTRKQAIRAYTALVTEGSQARERIENSIDGLRGQIEGQIKQVRKDVRGRIAPLVKQINGHVEPIVQPIIKGVSQRVESVGDAVQQRLSPLLAKVGIETNKPQAKTRKSTAKRTTRKPAPRKRAVKKAA